MSCNYNPNFMMVDNIGSTQIINQIENNWKSFLDWGFLNVGAYTNVTIPTSNISNFDLHILKPTVDKNQNTNTVWQSPRKDWVYETGVVFGSSSPIDISGIYVNNTFYPAPTGNANLGYKINYPEGKVIFNSGIPTNSIVKLNYSYKNIQIYKIEEFPYWKEIQYRSLENKTGLSLSDKGDFAIGTEHRIQLPAIIIETIARSDSKPFRLGDKSLIIEQDILLHVLSDNPKDKNNIIDILRLQEDRSIWFYDTNAVVQDNVYPLSYDGSKNPNGQNYLSIINNIEYRWIKSRIVDINISDMIFTNIRMYGSVVRVTNELIYMVNNYNVNEPTTPSAPTNLQLVII